MPRFRSIQGLSDLCKAFIRSDRSFYRYHFDIEMTQRSKASGPWRVRLKLEVSSGAARILGITSIFKELPGHVRLVIYLV